ncbi:proteasome subunit beta type-7-B isoform 1 [Corchorus capsularis]|uniref:Proteasome subunit beta type-7-B isoform 1 n=1 Tax=Corchorus capsularis TaxID=210143 RepID=A0A1R3H2M3_COCAP|nr:proteasome subunit beta type-7-B isoform 1 [Corchorus capsularis]
MSKLVIETPPRGSFNFDLCKRNDMLTAKGNDPLLFRGTSLSLVPSHSYTSNLTNEGLDQVVSGLFQLKQVLGRDLAYAAAPVGRLTHDNQAEILPLQIINGATTTTSPCLATTVDSLSLHFDEASRLKPKGPSLPSTIFY